jgi:ATP-dependent Clp protease ATP-binding subunit ClpB
MAEIKAHFSPELLNRFDEIVLFNRLLPQHMAPIVRREIAEISLPCPLACSEAVIQHLAALSYDPSFGARPVRRTVQHELLGPLSILLQDRPATAKDNIVAEMVGDKIQVRYT